MSYPKEQNHMNAINMYLFNKLDLDELERVEKMIATRKRKIIQTNRKKMAKTMNYPSYQKISDMEVRWWMEEDAKEWQILQQKLRMAEETGRKPNEYISDEDLKWYQKKRYHETEGKIPKKPTEIQQEKVQVSQLEKILNQPNDRKLSPPMKPKKKPQTSTKQNDVLKDYNHIFQGWSHPCKYCDECNHHTHVIDITLNRSVARFMDKRTFLERHPNYTTNEWFDIWE